MGYCCIPGCSERGGNGVSLHEIPSNIEMRKKWLQVIARANWTPNNTSNYSRVCSKHFTKDDFKQGLKIKCLHRTAVPSIFPSYPEYLKKFQKKISSTTAIQTRGNDPIPSQTCEEINSTTAIRKPENDPIPSQICEEVNSTTAIQKRKHSSMLSLTCEEINDDMMEEIIQNSVMNRATDDKATQVDVRAVKKNVEMRKLQVKYNKSLRKMQEMQEKVDECMIKLNSLENNKYVKSVLKIAKSANEEKELSAAVLLDLISNFQKKKPVFTDATIQIAHIWRDISPKGYEYARENLMLKLPCRTTLLSYKGRSNMDVGLNSLVENMDVGLNSLVQEQLNTES